MKAGQLIAEIAAPEVDAELEQAKAALEQAQRRSSAARRTSTTSTRRRSSATRACPKTGGVTQQQLDEKRSQFNIASSSLKAAQANRAGAAGGVKRLTEMQGFQKVVAPFNGTITARNYDAGALISATTSDARQGAVPHR